MRNLQLWESARLVLFHMALVLPREYRLKKEESENTYKQSLVPLCHIQKNKMKSWRECFNLDVFASISATQKLQEENVLGRFVKKRGKGVYASHHPSGFWLFALWKTCRHKTERRNKLTAKTVADVVMIHVGQSWLESKFILKYHIKSAQHDVAHLNTSFNETC